MSGWNYRVIRKDDGISLHEAYYNNEGRIISLSIEPISPVCEGLDELRTTLQLMLAALDEPVVNFHDLAPDASTNN